MEKIIVTIILVNIENYIIQTIIFEFENMMRSFIISLQIKHFLNEQIENVELFNFQICIQLFWIYMYRNLLISINKENQKKV